MEIPKRLESVNFQSESLVNVKPEEIDRSLICTICQEILKIPRECANCHNNFCKKCIDVWLSQKNDLCPFRCPGKIKLNRSHRIILDALRLLKFKCKNELNGCDIHLNYDNYLDHAHICPYNKLSCPNLECKTTVLAKDMTNHTENECPYQLHTCRICAFEWIGPIKIPHTCEKIAVKQYNELKSEIDNFMIKVRNKMNRIDEKVNAFEN